MHKSNVFDFFGWIHTILGMEVLLVANIVTNQLHSKNCYIYGSLSLLMGIIFLAMRYKNNK